MEQQKFYDGVQCRFNLRKPKGKKATPIYCVTCIDGKQYKLPTNVKVYPKHWDKKQQVAIISNVNSKLDNKNNQITNERLEEIRQLFSEFILYLCNESPSNAVGVLYNLICKDMKKKDINVIQIIRSALDYYYQNIHPTAKESTQNESRKSLKNFITYVEEKNLQHDITVFSQAGIYDFKEYLIHYKTKQNKQLGYLRVNRCCELVERLINNVLSCQNEYRKYKIDSVKYVKIADDRKQYEIKSNSLNDDEVEAIKQCTSLTETEKEYRTAFLLEIACGQRISDIQQILNGQYENVEGEEMEAIRVQTIKKGIYATIILTDEVKQYLEEAKDFRHIDVKNENLGIMCNKKIKTICEKAGLNRMIKYKDGRGTQKVDPLHKVVSSHWGRHTFVHNMLLKGYSPVDVAKFTGHSDDEMINKVYSNITPEERSQQALKAYAKKNKEEQTNNNFTVSDLSKVDETVSEYEFDTDLLKEMDSDYTAGEFNPTDEAVKKYGLTDKDIDFIRHNNEHFSVGMHRLNTTKLLKRLMQKKIVYCNIKGKWFPDELQNIKEDSEKEVTPLFQSGIGFHLNNSKIESTLIKESYVNYFEPAARKIKGRLNMPKFEFNKNLLKELDPNYRTGYKFNPTEEVVKKYGLTTDDIELICTFEKKFMVINMTNVKTVEQLKRLIDSGIIHQI